MIFPLARMAEHPRLSCPYRHTVMTAGVSRPERCLTHHQARRAGGPDDYEVGVPGMHAISLRGATIHYDDPEPQAGLSVLLALADGLAGRREPGIELHTPNDSQGHGRATGWSGSRQPVKG